MPDTHLGDKPPTPQPSDVKSPPPTTETEISEETHLTVSEMMVGTAMMFVGFLNVLLSISGGYEISTLPVILYFAGLATWAHARVDNVTVRYVVITLCVVGAAGFFHYGEVHFWHKQIIFWGTILMAMYFMFTTVKPKNTK